MQIGGHDSSIYDQQNLVKCQNCNRRLPPDNIIMHEAYCQRNYRKCSICGEMVDKNSVQLHHKDMHSIKICQFCSKQCMGRQLQIHLQKCIAKPQPCQFCSKLCPRGQLKTHQQTCLFKNKQCSFCKKMIPSKQYASHQQRCSSRQGERRDNSQEQRHQINIQQHPRQLFRQNSQNQLNIGMKRKYSSNQQINEYKKNTYHSKNVVERQHIKQHVSPIPISIQVTIKHKKSNKSIQQAK